MKAATDGTSEQPDTVFVRIYPGIVKDYVLRGVFPMLVPSGPLIQAGAVSCHVPRELANALLEDARIQRVREQLERGQKKSYGALIEGIGRALHPEEWAKRDADAEKAREEARAKYQAERDALAESAARSQISPSHLAYARDVLAELRKTAADDDAPASNRADGLWDAPGVLVMRERMENTLARFRVGQTVRYWSPYVKSRNDGAKMEIVKGYGLHSVSDDEGHFVDKSGDRVSYQWGYVAQARGGRACFYPAYELQTLDYERGHLRLVPPVATTDEERKEG